MRLKRAEQKTDPIIIELRKIYTTYNVTLSMIAQGVGVTVANVHRWMHDGVRTPHRTTKKAIREFIDRVNGSPR